MEPREFTGFECDHLRPKVSIDGIWHHVHTTTGAVLGPCEAGTYRVNAVYSGAHFLTDLVTEDIS